MYDSAFHILSVGLVTHMLHLQGKVMGCHNWIQLYNEERQGRLNYHGYIKPKQRGRGVMEPHDHEQLVTIQFKWDREVKLVSTRYAALVSSSPSVCF